MKKYVKLEGHMSAKGGSASGGKNIFRKLWQVMVLGLGAVLFLPLSVGAAANDLTYDVDTTVTIGGESFTILQNSQATTVIVGTDTLTVTVAATDVFYLRSSNKRLLVNSSVALECTTSTSQLTVSGPVTSLVITPTIPSTCVTTGGGGTPVGPGGGGAPASTAPVISSFTASPLSITAGQSATLSWNVANAATLSINQGVGVLPSLATGTKTVSPTVTTTYTLTATNSASQSVTATATVTVPGTTPAPTTPAPATPAVPGTPAPAGAHSNGTLVLDGSTIYLIKDGQRYGFRDAKEYQSHGYDFGQAVAANAIDKSLPTAGGNIIKALEGTLVLDASDNRTVYMIGTGNTKRGFATAEVFKALGYSFANLPKISLSDYSAGPAITSGSETHPDGALVLEGKTVWWILGSTRQGFESMAVFNTYGFATSKIVKSNSGDLALSQGLLVKFRDGTLVKDGSDYFLISDGKKLKFASAASLAAKGYKTANAIIASLANYESGAAIE